ncbi:hypothetical protein GGR53DRAFT_467229 [Hypoxylon sp. FL1150]|nr:hypothetical protein GGR53DRAFT_467229 [Hypoxylon sp. FL1150]
MMNSQNQSDFSGGSFFPAQHNGMTAQPSPIPGWMIDPTLGLGLPDTPEEIQDVVDDVRRHPTGPMGNPFSLNAQPPVNNSDPTGQHYVVPPYPGPPYPGSQHPPHQQPPHQHPPHQHPPHQHPPHQHPAPMSYGGLQYPPQFQYPQGNMGSGSAPSPTGPQPYGSFYN